MTPQRLYVLSHAAAAFLSVQHRCAPSQPVAPSAMQLPPVPLLPEEEEEEEELPLPVGQWPFEAISAAQVAASAQTMSPSVADAQTD